MKLLSRREALAGIGSFAGVTLFSGCAVNPVTGRREFMLMTENQEISLGKQGHGEIVQSYGFFEDDSIQNWFNERGQEMAKVTHRSSLPYTFTVLDNPIVNAFAVPGGFIYVTRGIMGYFNNEAQFAGVLAHELGHVNARHSASRYSKVQLASLTLGIGSILSEEFAKYAQFANLGATLMFLKFSRDDEREADRLGVEYSSKVGYDAVEMSEFFVTLERMHPGGGSLPSWQSTHPDPGNRIQATRSQALEFQQAQPGSEFVVKRNEYLDIIDGIIFGDDPRQGYVKNNTFYHPVMKFQFPVPDGWDLTNNPAEVRIVPEKENAMLIFTTAPGATTQDAATQFATDNKITDAVNNAVTVNGMNGIQMTGTLPNDDSGISITSFFIQKEENIFVFHGLSAPADAGTYTGMFRNTAYGFDNLTDQSLIDVSPQKIQVRSIGRNMTFSQVLGSFGVPEQELDKLAILNGFQVNDTLPAGTRVKIIA